jgi:7-keto-8-aminopelargonate synthetase-like enzyme
VFFSFSFIDARTFAFSHSLLPLTAAAAAATVIIITRNEATGFLKIHH